MNLLSTIGRGIRGAGRGILSGIDAAAQNSLTGGGLLDAALGQDGQPFQPTQQQRGALRSQFLSNIGSALQQGRPIGEGIQQYQQNAVNQIQAYQQAAARQKSMGMMKQFQAELAGAQAPESRNAVLAKYAPFIGPEATKQYADSFKAMQPDDSFVAVGDLGYLNKKTGAFQAVSRPTAQPTPERQAFENLLGKHNGDATKAFAELQAIMRPPAEQREMSPTEASLAVAAANGDPKAIAALKLLQQQKLATQQPQQPSRVLGFVPDGSGGMRAMEVTAGMPVPAGFQTAQGVNSMNTPTAAMRGMGERAATVDDLDAKIRMALENPLIKNGVGPLAGRLKNIQSKFGTLPKDLAELQTDLISYGAFQAGLHPVRGIGAMNYFEKVIGGLGQDPEQLIGKMNSNRAVSQSVQGVAGRTPMQQGNAPKPMKRYDPKTGRFE